MADDVGRVVLHRRLSWAHSVQNSRAVVTSTKKPKLDEADAAVILKNIECVGFKDDEKAGQVNSLDVTFNFTTIEG